MRPTVLMIEDNEQNSYLATFLLAPEWTVVCAVSGAEGIERARDLVPELILLDIQLPGMDGYAVARALRADTTLNAIPIVAVTSYAMPGDREKAFAAGCNGYIEKPIDPYTFADQVRAYAPPREA